MIGRALVTAAAAALLGMSEDARAQSYCLSGHVERDVDREDFDAHAEVDVRICFSATGSLLGVTQISGSFSESQLVPPIGDDPGFTRTCSGDFALSVPQEDGGTRDTRYDDLTFSGGVVSGGTLFAASLVTCTSPFGMVTGDGIRSIGPASHVIENGTIVKIDFDFIDPGKSENTGELVPDAPGPTPTATPPPTTVFNWTNGAGGAYATASNWEPAEQPGTVVGRDDTAVFQLGGSYTVQVAGARAARFVVRNGLVNLAGGTAQVVSSSLAAPSFTVGDGGIFSLVSGTFSSVHVGIGEDPGGVASAGVIDAGALWAASGRLTVGRAGAGFLGVTAGRLTSAESRIGGGPARGDALVTGPDARWETANLGLGFGGAAGTLVVSDGGRVVSADVVIGVEDGAESEVTVTGSNGGQPSSWKVGALEVGAAAAGRVEVLDGGRLDFDGLTLGNGVLGEGAMRVAGPSSAIGTPGSLLTVGRLETGALVVEDGARAEATTIVVGGGANGTVDVRGMAGGTPARLFATQELAVGVNATGTLRLADRAEAGIDGELIVGGEAAQEVGTFEVSTGAQLDASLAGVVVAKQGTFRAAGTSAAGDTRAFALVGDTLVQTGGVLQVTGGALVSTVGTLTVDGIVQVVGVTGLGKRSELTAPFVGLFFGRDEAAVVAIRDGGFMQSLDATIDRGSDVFVFGNPTPGAVDWEVERDLTINVGSLRFCPGPGIVTIGRRLVIAPGGGVFGNGTATAPDVQNDGVAEPGCSIGTLVIDGPLRQSARGRLVLEAAGPSDVDVLRVTGAAALDGTLEVRLIDGYLPKTGDFLPFLDLEGAVSGEFQRIATRGADEELVLTPATVGGVTGLVALTDAKACGGADGDGNADCERCDDCVDDDGDGLVDRADPDCAPAADGAGLGARLEGAEAKALAKCAATMAKVAATLADRTAKGLQSCADGVLACVQTKPGDARCLAKAQAKCAKPIAALAPEGDARRKARLAMAKACGAAGLPLAALVAPTGLGFGAETARCAAVAAAPLATVDDVIACIDRATVCRASALAATRAPRLAEWLRIGDPDGASAFACLPMTAPDGGALGDAKAVGKPLLKCQRAITAAATKLAARTVKGYRRCAAAMRACVQAGGGACLAKATAICAKATGALPTVGGTADAKLHTAVTKACGALAPDALRASNGLGFADAAPRCAALGVPVLDGPGALATCLTREQACGAAHLVEASAPRLREHLARAAAGS